jgi:hypothetical protein
MTDAEVAELEGRIQALRDKWVEPLGLGNWRITLHCYRDSGEYQEVLAASGPYVGGTCEAQWQYQRAEIHFNLFRLAPLSEREMEECVVHELCHLLLAEVQMCMDEEHDHHVEHATTALAQAFIWVRDRGITNLTTSDGTA